MHHLQPVFIIEHNGRNPAIGIDKELVLLELHQGRRRALHPDDGLGLILAQLLVHGFGDRVVGQHDFIPGCL